MSPILIVEDSLTILRAVKLCLVEARYEVLEATDGEEALRLAAEQKPALVLLDVILPKLNGYQVCRMLKSQPGMQEVPVIMLTSKSKESDRHWAMEQGADAYVTKPIEPEDLLRVIQQFVPLAG